MSPRLDLLMSAMVGALIQAQLCADQIKTETGIDYGLIYDPERYAPQPEPLAVGVPIWDADGVSQPIGPCGLVMLKAVEDLRDEITNASPRHGEELPRLFACTPGLAKLDPESDEYWIVLTESSWATFAVFGTNPMEGFGVNVYDRIPGNPDEQLPTQRLKARYQEYVPNAMALPRELKTAKACAARVLEQIRAKMLNDRIVTTLDIDFSPARPLPAVKG